MANAFKVVGEETIESPQITPNRSPEDANKALQILMLSLRVVGQRFVIAISNLFTAAALASAWFLWREILPNPTTAQLVGVGLYAAFLLAIEFVRRTK